MYNCGKPTIAAVNGVAAGNGARLVSVCDIALMASEARIGYPEMRLGIQAAMVVLHLMRLVGERVSRYLLLTGELIDAQTAQQIGLVNRVVPGNQADPQGLLRVDDVGEQDHLHGLGRADQGRRRSPGSARSR